LIGKCFPVLSRRGVIVLILLSVLALIVLNFVEWGYDTPVMDGGRVISIPEFDDAK
jgi:hypothetical protein